MRSSGHRDADHLPVPLAASLAPNPELAGFDVSNAQALAHGPFAAPTPAPASTSAGLADQLFPVTALNAPTSLTEVNAEGQQSPGRANGDASAMEVDADGDHDEEAPESEEDARGNIEVDAPASGSEFSAGSADMQKRDEEDEAMVHDVSVNSSTSGPSHMQYSASAYDESSAGPVNRSIVDVAELDPDLYGLRRSVSRAGDGTDASYGFCSHLAMPWHFRAGRRLRGPRRGTRSKTRMMTMSSPRSGAMEQRAKARAKVKVGPVD